MHSERAPFFLKLAAWGGVVFLHFPILIIAAYAFNTEDAAFSFPPQGLTLRWFSVAAQRSDILDAVTLSLKVAALATLIALVLGTLAAAALWRRDFFGKNAISLLLLLPIAVPQLVGPPGYFIGNMVYSQQGAIGNMPMAAAFTLVPIVLIALYLAFVKRLGAFDAL